MSAMLYRMLLRNEAHRISRDMSQSMRFVPQHILYREAFTAAALVLGIGIVEFKAFIEAFLAEIELGAVKIEQTFFVDDHLDAVIFKNRIIFVGLIHKFNDIGHS